MEAQVSESGSGVESPNRAWLAGIGGGLVGGVGFGLVMHFVMGAMPVVGSLYGQPTVLAGWVAHLVHSVIFALIFVALITRTGLRRYAGTSTRTAGLGTAYGAVLGIVTGAFVLPIWVNAMSGAGMPVPLLSTPSFLGHLLFGLLLGAVYAVSRATGSTAPTTGTEPMESEAIETEI
jgi:hypothetical protein